MSDGGDQDGGKGRLSLRPEGRLELGRTVPAGSVRQSFSHGRSKVIEVEVRKTRAPVAPNPSAAVDAPPAPPAGAAPAPRVMVAPGRPAPGAGRALTATELAVRQRALDEQKRDAARREAERREQEKITILSAAEEARRREAEDLKLVEEETRLAAESASPSARKLSEGQKAYEARRAAKAGMRLEEWLVSKDRERDPDIASEMASVAAAPAAEAPELGQSTERLREAERAYNLLQEAAHQHGQIDRDAENQQRTGERPRQISEIVSGVHGAIPVGQSAERLRQAEKSYQLIHETARQSDEAREKAEKQHRIAEQRLKNAGAEARRASRARELADDAYRRARVALDEAAENAELHQQELQVANDAAAQAAETLRAAEKQWAQDELDRKDAARKLEREQSHHASVLEALTQEDSSIIAMDQRSTALPETPGTNRSHQTILPKIRNKIFISYRRKDSEAIVGRIGDRFETQFGRDNVAIDIDIIPAGADFVKRIHDVLEESYVVLVVIGSDWLGHNPDGTMRINDEVDPVRFEVRTALNNPDIVVLPVLVGGARMPAAGTLPADLRALSTRNALTLDIGKDFNHHIRRIMDAVDIIRRSAI